MLSRSVFAFFLLFHSFFLFAEELPSIDSRFSKCRYDVKTINAYYKNFEALVKSENWNEILFQGEIALEASRRTNRPWDEAKISAQLTSTAFYLGSFDQALVYANRSHELAQEFEDPSLFLRSLYLKSAVYRALANKQKNEEDFYHLALKICEEALSLYSEKHLYNPSLLGKIYFNLGAAHADNPKGDLEKALAYYFLALDCFKSCADLDDQARTALRIGKGYLSQKKYDLAQSLVNEIRPSIKKERIAMQADYLEAQIKFAVGDVEAAKTLAEQGLKKAEILGAKEDESRLRNLLSIFLYSRLRLD